MPTTKFFSVATSGPTIDGREITPAQIDQMAANYNPKRYGARVWMEHLRSYLPDSQFKAYGDVLAVKADTDNNGNRVLLAQIDAIADLVRMNTDRQKVFWSIEVDPNFAGTGEAYLVGLAVTDSPASLGTEMLTFAVRHDKAPQAVKAHLFSAFAESPLPIGELMESGSTLLSKVKDMLAGKGKSDDGRFAQIEQAVTSVAESVADLKSGSSDFIKALANDVAALKTQVSDLTAKLSNTSDKPERPPVSGGGSNQTDC